MCVCMCVCSWLVYSDPGFAGFVTVLEVGEYPHPESWGFSEPYVGSLRPLRMVNTELVYDSCICVYKHVCVCCREFWMTVFSPHRVLYGWSILMKPRCELLCGLLVKILTLLI